MYEPGFNGVQEQLSCKLIRRVGFLLRLNGVAALVQHTLSFSNRPITYLCHLNCLIPNDFPNSPWIARYRRWVYLLCLLTQAYVYNGYAISFFFNVEVLIYR